MARLTTVAKAQKSKRMRICAKCRAQVQVGEPYKYIKKTPPVLRKRRSITHRPRWSTSTGAMCRKEAVMRYCHC